MHELAITENIRDIALRYAEEAKASQVTALYLVIGDLSSIVDESVQFYWDLVCKDTLCEGATLHFQRVPAQFQCRVCNGRYQIKNTLVPCPTCGSEQVDIVGGEEFRLESIEIEEN